MLGSPGEARALMRSACLAWGVDDEVRDDAELVVSELVANVVDHANASTCAAVHSAWSIVSVGRTNRCREHGRTHERPHRPPPPHVGSSHIPSRP